MPPKANSKKPGLVLSDEEKFALIDEIGKQEVLWNPQNENYKSHGAKNTVFGQIAIVMSTEARPFTGNFLNSDQFKFNNLGDFLKAEWVKLRNAFNSYKRKDNEAKSKSGTGAKQEQTWEFYQQIANFMSSVNSYDGDK